VPALASADQQFQVTSPSGFPAGGNPSYTTTQVLDSQNMGAPGKVRITLAPGVLASLAANPSCTKTTQYTDACKIGQGTADGPGDVPLASLTAYLVPPPDPKTDAAGIDLLTGPPANQTTHVAVDLVQTASGNVASVLKLDLSGNPIAGQLTKMSLTVNSTLNGKPFTRMPTNCNVTDHSSLTVEYAKGTETTPASPDFKPTGCDALPFSPTLSASAVKDAHDDGAEVVTTQTQGPGEAAGLSTSLQLPWPALSTNLGALAVQNTTTPVGSATAASPLQPAPLVGNAYLTGTPIAPTLTLLFPPPVALKLVGTVSLNTHTVTFSALPDVPQTSLVVKLFGGPHAAQAANCAPPGGIAHGSFTGQNGVIVSVSTPLTVAGCPPPPKHHGAPRLSRVSLAGLASGKPRLSFKVAHGTNAPKLRSLIVSLPRGLLFLSKRGISVSGPHRLRLTGGKLTITLKRPLTAVAVRIGSAALAESTQLERLARAHKAHPKPLVRVTATDAGGSRSSLRG